MERPILSIVIPCYNEEAVLPETQKRIASLLDQLVERRLVSPASFVVFVDDGSKDQTWELISKYHQDNQRMSGVKLSRNRGHQNALMAGLEFAREHADVAISVDADLQDDLSVMHTMMEHYLEGSELVFGVRSSRAKDSFFKRFTAQTFYKVMNWLGAKTIYNHADYRLMGKRALQELDRYQEVNLFLRGLVLELGFQTSTVTYERSERFAGESKYPLKKMISFAADGITSFSVKPIRLVTLSGFLIIFISILAAIYALISYFIGGAESGWTSLILSIWFLGGIQLFSLGLIGEYVGKTYIESKRRPRFIIESTLWKQDRNES